MRLLNWCLPYGWVRIHVSVQMVSPYGWVREHASVQLVSPVWVGEDTCVRSTGVSVFVFPEFSYLVDGCQ